MGMKCLQRTMLGLWCMVMVAVTPGMAQELKLNSRVLSSAKLLLAGVGSCVIDGSPGKLLVQGQAAFPLLRDEAGNDVAALIDDGITRSVMVSHDAWFKKSSWKDSSVNRFVGNSLSWLLGNRKKARVLCFGSVDIEERLKTLGHLVASPAQYPGSLAGFDAVVLYWPTILDAKFSRESALLTLAAMQKGMPVMSAGIGWVFDAYGDGKRGLDIALDYSANLALKGFGVEHLSGYAGKVMKPVPVLAALHRLIDLFQKGLAVLQGTPTTKPGADSLAAEVYEGLSALRDWKRFLGDAGFAVLVTTLQKQSDSLVPTTINQVAKSDTRRRMAIIFSEMISQRHPDALPWLWPKLGEFPGIMEGSVQTGLRSSVQLAVPRWQSLGVYVNAGTNFTITVQGLPAGQKLPLRLGAHTDNLVASSLAAWERWPIITERFLLSEGVNTVFVRFSGALYADVPDAMVAAASADARLALSIDGGFAMPVYRHGMDGAAFLQELSASLCPMVDLEGEYVAFSLPRKLVPPDFEPVRSMAFWDKVAQSVPALLGRSPTAYKQRFVADRQIRIGYMHSGYPIMTFLDVAAYQLGGVSDSSEWRGQYVYKTGAWGHFHELGHNYQSGLWTFGNGGEVTVNLFTLYVMDTVLGIQPLDHPYLLRHAKAVQEYQAKPVWSEWSKNPFVGLHTYAYLAQEFGWEPFKRTFMFYDALPKEKQPKTDQEELDMWVLEFSRQTGRNLVPYFRQWAWPVSVTVEKQLSALPVWKR